MRSLTETRSPLLAVIATLLAATACAPAPDNRPSNIDGTDGGNAGAALGGHCSQNSDCASSDCFAAAPGGLCTQDCSKGQTCPANSACQPLDNNAYSVCLPNCTGNSDCRNGYTCTSGQCQPACSSNGDCLSSQSCNMTTGLCTSSTGCQSNSDCPTNQVCDIGTGTCSTPSTGCTSNASCGANMTCNTGTGICSPAGCTSNSDCGAHMTCNTSTGTCSASGCTSNSDCGANMTCNTSTGTCSASGCTSNSDCGANMTCNTSTGVCTTNTSSGSFTTVPLSGCAFIGFNTPATFGSTVLTVSVDTGSTDMAVATTSCGNCGVTPELNVSGLTSLGTTSAQYGSGSWSGNEYSEKVQVGPEMPAVTMEFAGMTSQQQFFIGQDCEGNQSSSPSQGIMGMGPLDLSDIGMSAKDAYFTELVAQAGIANEFAIELCSSGGNMWFGGYDSSFATGTPQYSPMVTSGNAGAYYSVNITSGTLGSKSLGNFGDAVVDTGTWGFYMPTAAYNSMVTALTSDSGATSMFGSGALGSSFWSQMGCVSPSGGQTRAQIDAALPPLNLTLPSTAGGSFTISLPATRSYLVMTGTGSSAQYCAGAGDDSQIGMMIMGAAAQESFISIFDPGNSRIGFVTGSNCP